MNILVKIKQAYYKKLHALGKHISEEWHFHNMIIVVSGMNLTSVIKNMWF